MESGQREQSRTQAEALGKIGQGIEELLRRTPLAARPFYVLIMFYYVNFSRRFCCAQIFFAEEAETWIRS